MNAEPTMAFAIPPPASPTGFGVCVRKAQLIDRSAVNQIGEDGEQRHQHQDDRQHGHAGHNMVGNPPPQSDRRHGVQRGSGIRRLRHLPSQAGRE
jgi:hypothetical protein